MTTWVAPPTFTPGTALSASDLNKFRDDLIVLLSERPIGKQIFVDTVNKTTTSTTFVDTDGTNHKVTVTPNGTRVKVTAQFRALAGTNVAEFDIYSVSLLARFGDATHGMAALVASTRQQFTLIAYFTGLTPAIAQEFRLQFRSLTAVTATIENNAIPVILIAEEF